MQYTKTLLLACLLLAGGSSRVHADEDPTNDESHDAITISDVEAKAIWGTLLKGALGIAGQLLKDEDSTVGHHELDAKHTNQASCDKDIGTVCIPTACMVSRCALFKDAVCVDDKCGCEARFFWAATQNVKEKSFWGSLAKGALKVAGALLSDEDAEASANMTIKDVTKLCGSSNFVMNYVHFTSAKHDLKTSADTEAEDAHVPILKFYKEFNILVTELLKDITDYLSMVSMATPTQENIDQLKLAIRTLSSLQRASRDKAAAESIEDSFREAVKVLAEIVDDNKFSSAVKHGRVIVSDPTTLLRLQNLIKKLKEDKFNI